MNMDTKKHYTIFSAVIVALSCFFATCKKAECVGYSYSLKESWSVSPGSDSISVGDTITIYSAFPNHPFDYSSNKNVDFSGNAEIGTTLGVYVLKPGTSNFGSAVDSFRFIQMIGRAESAINADHVKQIYHTETGNMYILQLKMIALKKGIYCLGISDGIGRRKNSSSCNDNAGILYTISNSDNHIYYYEQFYSTVNLPAGEREHAYLFKVK